MDWANFLTVLGHIANVAGLVTFAVSIATFLNVQNETLRIRNKINTLSLPQNFDQHINIPEGVTTDKPIAWAFSLTSNQGSVKKQVQEFLKIKRWNMDIEEIEMQGIYQIPEDVSSFYQQVRKKKIELGEKGYTEVHLFCSGPVQAGTILGCMLSNWLPVKLYHWPQGGSSYIYWTTLVKI